MPYDRTKRWVVVRRSTNLQQTEIARYHKFSDAENCARVLQQREPQRELRAIFSVIFDAG